MEDFFAQSGELAGKVKAYLNNRIALAKLELAEKTSKIVAVVIAGFMVALFVLLFLMFLGMMAAQLLTQWIGASYAGSLIVAGVYLFSAILLWKSRDRFLSIPIMNAILHKIFEDEEA